MRFVAGLFLLLSMESLEVGGAEVIVVRKRKFHEILAGILSVEVLEVGGVWVIVCKEGKFHEIFGSNISTIVNGKFGSRLG